MGKNMVESNGKHRKKLLIISHDKVGPKMAGPGIRYHQIAIELSKQHDVTLATFNPSYLEGLKDVPYAFEDIKVFDFKSAFDRHDAILALWLSEEMISYAKSTGKLLIFDLYAPVPVENLIGQVFSHRKPQPEDDYNYSVSIESYRRFLSAGDFFLCSNNIQHDYWTGFAFATGSITPSAYREFPVYERIGLGAMGINLDELEGAGKVDPLRKKFPTIKSSDIVLVWTGGIWDWFDAETPIRAIKWLHDHGRPEIKLVFLGTRHPNSDVPEMGETEKAFALADELGLTGTGVFFMSGWIPYNDRLDYLLAADIAIYAHKPSIEARFSHRTRVLDHILTQLPTLATQGDYFADLIAEKHLGTSVEPQNVEATVKAITDLSKKDVQKKMQSNIKAIQKSFTWENTLLDLTKFLQTNPEPRALPASLPTSIATHGKSQFASKINRYVPRPIKERVKRHLVRKNTSK
jgi:hypothetical protein